MAHTDACKIQATQFVEKLVNNGMSVEKACAETERESDGIPAETIRRWWKEIKIGTTRKLVKNDQPENDSPPEKSKPQASPQLIDSPRITDAGGKREGAGRPPKPAPPQEQPTEAWQFATIAISQLERIRKDDPRGNEALNTVKDWIENKLRERGSDESAN
jgi:hypothetical protein